MWEGVGADGWVVWVYVEVNERERERERADERARRGLWSIDCFILVSRSISYLALGYTGLVQLPL